MFYLKTRKVLGAIFRYLVIILTGAMVAATTYILIVPNDFAPSGITGICVMVQYKLGISIGWLNLAVNFPLCVIAFCMGFKQFAVKSYIFALSYSFTYLMMQKWNPEWLQYNANGQDTILPVLIAGVLSGFATVIAYELNGSQCGTDVVSKILSEKKPEFNFFWVSFAINASVALISLFVYSDVVDGVMVLDYKPVALCVLYCLSDSMLADIIFRDQKEAAQIVVITPFPDEVLDMVTKKTHHTATRLDGIGTYSGQSKAILIFIVNKFQVPGIKRDLKNYDQTFCYITPVSETVGWFDSRKVGKTKRFSMRDAIEESSKEDKIKFKE